MTYVILITVLLMIQYMFFTLRTGMARDKDSVDAPATTGNEHFERCFRVQVNTLEQLAVTLPMMWVCAIYFRPDVAAILGFTFLIGRFIYSAAYISNPPKRVSGMIIGFLSNVVLVLCCLWVVISRFI